MLQPLIDHISRYVVLSPGDITHIESAVTVRKLRKRQFLLQEGDICRHENFVLKGCLRTYETDEKGQEHVILFSVEDWWVGDLYGFLTGSPSRMNVECLEDCVLAQISRETLEELYIKVPALERFFRKLVQNAYIAVSRRLLSSMSRPAQERYLEFIEKYPDIEQRVPDRHIASFLGIAPESLSRIRRQHVSKS
jgi:CRP-like cAMP-binding protein